MAKGWSKYVQQVRNLESSIKEGKKALSTFQKKRISSLTKAETVEMGIMKSEIKKLEGILDKELRKSKSVVYRSMRQEERKQERPINIPTIGNEKIMTLGEGMQFFARLIDIFDPDEKSTEQFARDVGLVKFPLRMSSEDTRRVGEWFYSNLAGICADEVVDAIENRELGITLSKSWSERKRKMVYEGVPVPRADWGKGEEWQKVGKRRATTQARASRLYGRGLYSPPVKTHLKKAKKGGIGIKLRRRGEEPRNIVVRPDHPLIWTGKLLSKIEGWSDYSKRSAYYGVRRTGAKHPMSGKDIVEIANFMMYRFNFLARPAVKARVRDAAKRMVVKLINMLVG